MGEREISLVRHSGKKGQTEFEARFSGRLLVW